MPPIGLDLSGEIGRLETAETDKAITIKCEENGIKVDLSKRYVDDKTVVLGCIPYGYRWSEGWPALSPKLASFSPKLASFLPKLVDLF